MTTKLHVKEIEKALKGHRRDGMSQDSGDHCECGSDSRFSQAGGADPPWKSIDEHRAHMVMRYCGILSEQYGVQFGDGDVEFFMDGAAAAAEWIQSVREEHAEDPELLAADYEPMVLVKRDVLVFPRMESDWKEVV